MNKLFQEISISEIDRLVSEATERAFMDSLALGLPVSGSENGVVVTKLASDPAFEHLREKIDAHRQITNQDGN